MKITIPLAVAALMLGPTTLLDAVEANESAFRQNVDWIILSGNAEGHSRRGPLPWIYAIRKSLVVSACIETDFSQVDQPGSPDEKKFNDASEDEIQKVPAMILITTSELAGDGAFKEYVIRGLTHATAPAMLEKILEATAPARR